MTLKLNAFMLATVAWFAAPMAPAQKPGTDLSAIPPIPTAYHPARTAWGDPDLRGGWPIDFLNGTPMQRDPKQGTHMFLSDAEFAERSQKVNAAAARYNKEELGDKLGQGHWVEMGEPSRRTSLLIAPADGRLPAMTDEGLRRKALMRSSWRKGQSYDWVDDFDSWDRCITRGMPASMLPMQYNNGIRIFQAPGLVALQLEMIHEVRIIPVDGKAGLPNQIRNWMGESRGHWENGNTLVVETTNLKAGPSATNIVTTGSPPENDTPISDRAHILERFTMIGPNSIVYEMTYTDPIVFTAPWTVRLDWRRNDGYGIFEYACHEGDVQIRNYISASRAQRAKEGEKHP
ncbi:hypothetical protein [Sphingomonas sp. MMS24-J13]|uniref:hypothetical protein n=1 Tax=Sphingomonas sp. MMS24-J13 TaxID=3238686 RepID=UPI00384F3380